MTPDLQTERAIRVRVTFGLTLLLLGFGTVTGISCYQRRCHDSEFTCQEWCDNDPDIDSCDAGGGAVTEECDKCGEQTCLSWQVCCTCDIEDSEATQWDLSGCGDPEYIRS